MITEAEEVTVDVFLFCEVEFFTKKQDKDIKHNPSPIIHLEALTYG